ncbi:MAG: hypothetical protein K6E50_13795 [Lachnospiraceae bacterium]|nr:hypothetical protein [Lachnospiraceae bacterium]
MYNIIKSLNFTNRRNLAVVLTVFSMVMLPLILPVMLGVSMKEVTGDAYLLNLCGDLFLIWLFPIMILGCIAASGDAGDKTLHYEILAGHSRTRVFFARVLCALFWSVLLTAFFFYLPLVYYGLLNGWNAEGMRVSDIVLRALLSLFPMFRVAAFCIMVSVLFRSAGKGIGFSYLFIELQIMAIEIAGLFFDDMDKKYLSGAYNVQDLLTLSNSRNYVINGEKVEVYETALEGGNVLWTIAVSLLLGGIYLAVAYLDFTKRDRS